MSDDKKEHEKGENKKRPPSYAERRLSF